MEPPLVVCPKCRYGFLERDEGSHAFQCPRRECGHEWDAATATVAAVHGAGRREARPELRVVAGGGPSRMELVEDDVVLGRYPDCPLPLLNGNVSRRHLRVERRGDVVRVEDLGSKAGTLINGLPVRGLTRLSPGDMLLVGGMTLEFAVRFEADTSGRNLVDHSQFIASAAQSVPLMGAERAEVVPLAQRRLSFGREADRDVVLPHALISRKHALLDYQDGDYYLCDTQSRTGSFVNGKSVIRVRLELGDRIQLGPFLFLFERDWLRHVAHLTLIGVEAKHLTQTAGALTILDDISLVLRPGEFVGLLGPSGAGKTTLLDALNGMRPAQSGQVLINSVPFYEQYECFRHLIGYVPQDDIIHAELTSRQALTFAGRLRLPHDVTAEALARLVGEALAALDLTSRADVPIKRLSGGQRKRASVGVELLSKPGLLYLDEPTSGLDPATESRLMQTFRKLADQGTTVVCTTHVMENVDLFDKVVVLASGGRLAFFGPPLEAKAYFGIGKFTALYERLEEKTPREWQDLFRASEGGLASGSPTTKSDNAAPISRRGMGRAPATSLLGQWSVLSRRFAAVLGSDKTNLALLAAQPLVIAGLIAMACRDLPDIYFLLIVSALWFGCSTAAQQIVKERSIFRRERMVNLRLDGYVLSKFPLLALISAGQGLLMLGIIWLFRGLEGNVRILITSVTLASWNGVSLGLIISALATNPDKAMAVVPMVLLPQIVLGGVLVALPDLNMTTRAATNLAASKWANQALEVALLEDRTIDRELLNRRSYVRPIWNLHPAHDLSSDDGRLRFIRENAGARIHKMGLLGVDFAALGGLILVQLVAVRMILRWQDVL